MAETTTSPEPGFYVFETPIGWESDSDEELSNQLFGFTEDPVLKAMRLEAEAEQYDEYIKARGPMRERAKKMKKYMNMRRQLKFQQADPKSLSALSVSSFETDDFMSEPSLSIHELHGETAWMNAYKAKAQQKKKLRKLISGSDKSPVKPKAKTPVKIKMPSPAKIAQAYAQQSPAIQQAVAAVLATPKKFGDIVLDSDDEDEVPLPTTKFAKPGKKSFFDAPALNSPSPIKTPSPFKVKPNIKKSFFAPPTISP